MKKLSMILAGLFTVAILAGCTPHEVEVFKTLSKPQQDAVIAHLQSRGASRDCNEAIDKHFSGDKARMKKIVWRESRNNPRAQNSRSSAAGCVQALKMHDWRYYEVGCTPADKYNADCNVKVGDHLYRQAGWRPWAQTDY